MPYPEYKLTLHKTYYDKGFFNLGIDVEKYVRPDDGPIVIQLGDSKSRLDGRVDRKANLNGTPRIHGGLEMQNWVQKHFQLGDVVDVLIISPNEIWLKNDEP